MTFYTPAGTAATMGRALIENRRGDRDIANAQLVIEDVAKRTEIAYQEEVKRDGVYAAYINAATTTINSAKQVVTGCGQIGDAAKAIQTKNQVAEEAGKVKAGGSADALSKIQLSEHTTVGQRFNKDQLALLTSNKPVATGPVTDGGAAFKAHAQSLGFSEKEAGQLDEMTAHGTKALTADQAADFVMDNKAAPIDIAESQKRNQTDKAITFAMQQAFKTPQRILTGCQQDLSRSSKQAGETANALAGLRDTMVATAQTSGENQRDYVAALGNARRG